MMFKGTAAGDRFWLFHPISGFAHTQLPLLEISIVFASWLKSIKPNWDDKRRIQEIYILLKNRMMLAEILFMLRIRRVRIVYFLCKVSKK